MPGLDFLDESQINRFLGIVIFRPSVHEKSVILFDNDFGTIGLRDFQLINNLVANRFEAFIGHVAHYH